MRVMPGLVLQPLALSLWAEIYDLVSGTHVYFISVNGMWQYSSSHVKSNQKSSLKDSDKMQSAELRG